MVTCSVDGCKNRTGKGLEGITFHRYIIISIYYITVQSVDPFSYASLVKTNTNAPYLAVTSGDPNHLKNTLDSLQKRVDPLIYTPIDNIYVTIKVFNLVNLCIH